MKPPARAVVAVLVAFAAMMVLVFALSIAPWFALGVDAVLEPARYDSTAAFDAYAVGVGVLGALFAGRLCAAIGRSPRAVVALAALCFLGGMGNAFMHYQKPEPPRREPGVSVMDAVDRRREPPWFTLLMPCLGAAGVLFAGRRAGRHAGRAAPVPSEYVTVAAIRAAPDAVWRILTDAPGYAAWNREIVAVKGRFAPGERIVARVRLGSGAIRSVPMRVTAFVAPSRMEWTGGLPLGLFVGWRSLAVAPRDGGTEFRMRLRMSGPLAPLILKSVGNRQPEIDSFAAALRARAEQRTAQPT